MVNISSYCGIDCDSCEYKEQINCKGCKAYNGDMFYGECKIAKCAISRDKRFCGECEEFACEKLKSYSFDKEHGDDGARIDRCAAMKNQLVAEARAGVDPVSVCGHHCDYCFMGQWCGGCRSTYNCCSYATICEDKVCPNVACSRERGLDGCYECPELNECTKGYYSNTNEYIAKATARFIHEYGKKVYSQTLKKAIAAGVNYPKSFDESGSVDAAFNILKQYI